ncbi:VOC family protein [Sphingomonas psychrolutea]|uniref:Glyoxalase n=1 Tax=Sphingomonas psychrolutea TaxID=1259676 RepID=A0ABQ1GQX2_9SPHN|nr:VOC family protein [Sphingomonas psychrolutea]GGA48224.1 glyoxalase [Sphingomonas psychrolutea]
MIDHVTFGVSDFAQSCAFYDAAFAPLGIARLVNVRDRADVAAYGDDRPWFWIVGEDPTRGKLHLALSARSRLMVEAFHAAACAAGGRDNGAPGLRPQYDSNHYGAFVLDPDGNNIEAVCRLPG